MTHGPKIDPGWNMKLVMNQLKYVAEQVRKEPNMAAYQYMPERIDELIKQDGGFWGSDAVPTIDVWDCYFREAEDGKGWYRRIFLDWDLGKDESFQLSKLRRIAVDGESERISLHLQETLLQQQAFGDASLSIR